MTGTPRPQPHKTAHGVRYFNVGEGFDLHDMKTELYDMVDVLLGREDPPIDTGILTMMECAEAYHARAKEMEMELLLKELEGVILKGTQPYKFRTGPLRSFIELSSKTIELGSRRVTYWRDIHQP